MLFGIFMFGLGIITGGQLLKRPPITIVGDVVEMASFKDYIDEKIVSTKPTSTTNTTLNINNLDTNGFVASNRGKYYYPVNCNLAKNLSQNNLIYFDTEEKAIIAGYARQTKCD
ncbi:MAG: hypothetical protein PHY32_02655 [Candidatus Pacebacteria bacterium]|nr:hypothetical protein [Candidatus Paceibacterota bacterium]